MNSFFINLIKSNTGYNSKTFIMLIGVGMTLLVLLATIPLIYISVFLKLTVPWYGVASFITSLATLAGVVIWGKVKTDSFGYNEPLQNNNEETPIVD